MVKQEETIAAISTAPGSGGIGIVRVSGEKAFEIAGKIFKGKKDFIDIKSHTINYGRVEDPDSGRILDEVLLTKMNGPNTFTREDIVEINCHGGMFVLKEILSLLISKGAKLAGPGEFTKRAFLNGRIDLSQAEAVIDLINARTAESTKAAIDQLEGRLSVYLKEIRNTLIELLAHIAVTVDYPEHDIEEITSKKVYETILDLKVKLNRIIKSFDRGRILREGVNVVIAGRPNVGKSSLLNELAGKNRAIVTEIPGTTRDIIEEYINIKGIPVKLTDTAGLRETGDIVEKIGVEKAAKALEMADLAIIVLDASEGVSQEDIEILRKVQNKKKMILLNKVDLPEAVTEIGLTDDTKVIRTSLKENIGIDELENEIAGIILKDGVSTGDEVLLTNIRHKNLLEQALKSIDYACEAYKNGMPLDCLAIDLNNAAAFVGEITGETVSESVMQEIFNRFCIGK